MSSPTPVAPGFAIDDDFDIELANELARLETYNKHHYRPNTYLHKWWARRCGTTFRLILKHLVTRSDQQDYYSAGGLAGKLIVDPMMGGGTTLHEALRLGANVAGFDLDPIPVLQAQASLRQTPLAALGDAYDRFFDALKRRIGPLYRFACPDCAAEAEIQYILYGARRHCHCREVLVVDALELRREADGTVYRLCPDCGEVVAGNGDCPCRDGARWAIVERRQRHCPECAGPFEEALQLPFYRRYEPLAVRGLCSEHGAFLTSANDELRRSTHHLEQRRRSLPFAEEDFCIEPGLKSSNLLRHGINHYLDLFSTRQLLYLSGAMKELQAFDGELRLPLALLVSTSLEFNAMLCGYKGQNVRRAGAVRHVFSHHAYSIPYTALENNPLFSQAASGSLHKLFQSRIVKARKWAVRPKERVLRPAGKKFVAIDGEIDGGEPVASAASLGEGRQRFLVQQSPAATLPLADDSVDAVVTDPPYFDSVQYSDLSAYFRVWLRQMLPDAADWNYDVGASAVDLRQNGDDRRYESAMTQIFGECHRVLNKRSGRLVFTFHHWNAKGWAALTVALKRAGFVLLNRYVVLSEHPISVHINKMNALRHDTILVLAPVEAGLRPSWDEIARLRTVDSAEFCADCGTLLGSMLVDGRSDENIRSTWQEALA